MEDKVEDKPKPSTEETKVVEDTKVEESTESKDERTDQDEREEESKTEIESADTVETKEDKPAGVSTKENPKDTHSEVTASGSFNDNISGCNVEPDSVQIPTPKLLDFMYKEPLTKTTNGKTSLYDEQDITVQSDKQRVKLEKQIKDKVKDVQCEVLKSKHFEHQLLEDTEQYYAQAQAYLDQNPTTAYDNLSMKNQKNPVRCVFRLIFTRESECAYSQFAQRHPSTQKAAPYG